MHKPPVATVHILLACYQGSAYIRAQLDSIATQTHANWSLTISDDGSTDDTVAVCREFVRLHPDRNIRLLEGPQQRSTANFFHLMQEVISQDANDLFAFCDQDDVWLPNKLERAVAALARLNAPASQPLLYGGRTQQVDVDLKPLGFSPLPRKALGFGNALLQNVASGNTMVFNHALLQRLRCIQPSHAVWHDWSAYLTVTGCAGQMCFDPEPCLLYRQHPSNLVGAQDRSRDKLHRLRLIAQGCYREWGDKTEQIMLDLAPHMSESARQQLRVFQHMRNETSPWRRLRAGWHSGLWRQSRAGEMTLFLALACKRI
jgi:glycosyltransferase involved in cell wall biosynthesis